MNLSDQALLEMNALCNALVDGTLDSKQRVRLEQMLATSDEARRFYVRAMALSASLHDYASEMQSEAAESGTGLQPVAGAGGEHHPSNRPAGWWSVGSLAAAAAIMLAFWLGGWLKRDAGGESVTNEKDGDEWVAQISGGANCQWIGTPLQPGDNLHRGQRLELASGIAEITFDSGAEITLEGPAALDVDSEWEAALARGTMKASVPAEAIGFHVANPAVDVVDPDTEFSMVAEERGTTEVFVIKGAIEIQSRETAKRTQPALVLRANQARRFVGGAASEVRDREEKIARFKRKLSLDRFVRPARYIHWSFDEADGTDFRGAALGGGDGEFLAKLHTDSGTNSTNVHGAGRFGGGLQLDGACFASASLPGLTTRSARTAAFWVRIPENAAPAKAGAMLAWPFGGSGLFVEIAWNGSPEQGALGALRTRVGRGNVVGTTPLRDGRWHHLALVFSPARKQGGMQIRQYLDGRLEGASAKRAGKRAKALVADPAITDTLWIGRDLKGTRFHGEIDELFLADRALVPQEIRPLMLRNQPALPEALAVNSR
jgi:hypothetical protein